MTLISQVDDTPLRKWLGSLTGMTLEFVLEATDNINPGSAEVAGNKWRGALGATLRIAACQKAKAVECQQCELRKDCSYFSCYGETNLLRPYILWPALDGKDSYKTGDDIRLDLTLIGTASRSSYAFIRAMEKIGRQGIGQGRGKFHVRDVVVKNFINLPEFFEPREAVSDGCRIEFLTPLKIKTQEEGIHYSELSFQTFFRLLLKRIYNLNNIFCSPEPAAASVKKAVHDLAIEAGNLTARTPAEWQDYLRHSGRQNMTLKMGGLRGFILLKGDVSMFYPYLKIGEMLSAGLSTTSGFGRYKLAEIGFDNSKD